MRMETVVITGYGFELPAFPETTSLFHAMKPAEPATFDPVAKLGRKGMLYKDRSTKLALCAVQTALGHAGLTPGHSDRPERVGVVVSSNLGNADTVCRVVETIRSGGVEQTSPLDLPNASSNVIASSIAIRFGCRNVNLMLCNGATSGIDALYVAANVIRAGRAHRMLVVGVEPFNPVVDKLMCDSIGTDRLEAPGRTYGDGAACVVLEAASAAAERHARIWGVVGGYTYAPPHSPSERSVLDALSTTAVQPGLWLTPDRYWQERQVLVDRVLSKHPEVFSKVTDLNIGEFYGALGVFQCAAACEWFSEQGTAGHAAVITSGGMLKDGCATLVLSAGGEGAA